jgi:carotenoid cleavage dioxygenase
MFHVMNAWEDGNRIFADVMESAEAPLFPRADGKPTDPAATRARLTRWTFDLDSASDRFSAEQIDDLVGEFPRIDDRRVGLPYRHGWFGGLLPGSEADNFETIAHVDLATGRRSLLPVPAGDVPSEPVFVPASAQSPEGDGWLLTVVWRPGRRGSDLVVVPALDVAAGPVATIELPQRVPFGFHGNFVPTA